MTTKQEIVKALDKIRPSLHADDGDLEFIDFKDHIVKVRLKGNCAGCPLSSITLALGVERELKEKFKDVERVEAE